MYRKQTTTDLLYTLLLVYCCRLLYPTSGAARPHMPARPPTRKLPASPPHPAPTAAHARDVSRTDPLPYLQTSRWARQHTSACQHGPPDIPTCPICATRQQLQNPPPQYRTPYLIEASIPSASSSKLAHAGRCRPAHSVSADTRSTGRLKPFSAVGCSVTWLCCRSM